MAGTAYNYSVHNGTWYLMEGPAGQPLRVLPARHQNFVSQREEKTELFPDGWVNRAKNDFADQAAVDAFVAARTLPAVMGRVRGYDDDGNELPFSEQIFVAPRLGTIWCGGGFTVGKKAAPAT
jgi:hypothetical protein